MFTANFKAKSEKILGVFHKTKSELKALNAEVILDSEKKQNEIDRLNAEVESNIKLVSDNTSIIQNIEKIIGE